MADRAHSTSRRALLAGLTTTPLLTMPVAAGIHPDAIILGLEPEFLERWAAYQRACAVESAIDEAVEARVGSAS